MATYRRALLLLAAAAALALIATSEPLHQLFVDLLRWAEPVMRARPILGALLFVLLSAASAMLAFFSSAVIVPAAVLVWGHTMAMLLLWTGWILGGLIAYTIGAGLGRAAVERLASAKTLEHYQRYLSPGTPWPLVLLFQAALPSEIPGYLLGLVRYPVWKYLAALAIAELPYAAATVFLGEGFLQRRTTWMIAFGAAIAAFSYWVLHLLRARTEP